jgi:HPt (histidine-containing phosphotransfer) domain-containing protein
MEHKSLDLSVLQAIFEDDAAAVTEFLNDVISTVDKVEVKIVDALAREDWTAGRAAIHEMKGMCASSGCLEVAQLCLDAEHDLDAQRYAEVTQFIEPLHAACERLRTAIAAAPANAGTAA